MNIEQSRGIFFKFCIEVLADRFKKNISNVFPKISTHTPLLVSKKEIAKQIVYTVLCVILLLSYQKQIQVLTLSAVIKTFKSRDRTNI